MVLSAAMDYRLPTTVVPNRYDLRLEPDLAAATFAGEAVITVEVETTLTELAIQSVSVAREGGVPIHGSITLDEATERARFVFPAAIAPGQWRLTVRFTGTLNDRLHGFYRSTYKDPAGQPHTIAATQFEATDARRGFPCWDEPAFKAVFGVTLVVAENLAAVSNCAVVREESLG